MRDERQRPARQRHRRGERLSARSRPARGPGKRDVVRREPRPKRPRPGDRRRRRLRVGADTYGQIGDGGSTDKLSPATATEVSLLGRTHAVASGAYSLGLNAAGEVFAWGDIEGDDLGMRGGEEAAEAVTPPAKVDSEACEISATANVSLDRTKTTKEEACLPG